MAKLPNQEKIERFYLPSTKDLAPDNPDCAWVDMNIGKLTATDIVGVDPNGDEVSASIAMLVNRIRDWNYMDAAGEKLPINFENVRQLDLEDYGFLAQKIPSDVQGLTAPEKKS